MFTSTTRFELGTVLVSQRALFALGHPTKTLGLDAVLRRHKTLACGEMNAETLIDRLLAAHQGRQVVSEFAWERCDARGRERHTFVVTTDAARSKTTVMLASEIAATVEEGLLPDTATTSN